MASMAPRLTASRNAVLLSSRHDRCRHRSFRASAVTASPSDSNMATPAQPANTLGFSKMVLSRCSCSRERSVSGAPSAVVMPFSSLYSTWVDTASMLNSAASAPAVSSTVAAQRPVRCSRAGSAAVSSSAMLAAAATFRNSYSANLPDGAYSVEIPSSRTYSPSSSAGHVMRCASVLPFTITHTMAASSSTSVMPLLLPWSIRHVIKK